MRILFLTSHVGLGHATRDAAIAASLNALMPEAVIEFLTAEPAASYFKRRGFRVNEVSWSLRTFSRAVEEFVQSRFPLFRVKGWAGILQGNWEVMKEAGVLDDYDRVVSDEFWELFLAGNEVVRRTPFLTDLLGLPVMGSPLRRFIYERVNRYMLGKLRNFLRVLYLGYREEIPGLDKVGNVLRDKLTVMGPVSSLTEPVPRTGGDDGYRVLVLNGGTSARAWKFLRGALELLRRVSKSVDIKVRVIAGPRADRGALRSKDVNAEILGLTTDMEPMYAWSDVVIARSGRTTVADLECVGRKSVLVPISGHVEQEFIARNACSRRRDFTVCKEGELSSERCVKEFKRLLSMEGEGPSSFNCSGALRVARELSSLLKLRP